MHQGKTRVIALICLILMIFVFTGCTGGQTTPSAQATATPPASTPAGQTSAASPDAPKSYKICHLAPLTGNQSFQGQVLINCAQMAVDEINAKGGINGVPIEYIPVDETSQTSTGIEAVQKAIDLQPVAIVGPNRSATALAAHELWKNAKIPTIIDASNTAANDPNNPYTFRVQLAADKYIPILGRTVKEFYGETKVAVIYANNEYAKGLWDGTLPGLQKYGIEAALVQTINDGDTDFSTQLLAVKNAGLKMVFGYAYEAEMAILFKQAKELGLNFTFISGRGADNPAAMEIFGEQYMEGMVCSTSLCPGDPDPKIQDFIKKYETKFNERLSPTHANHYDSIYILADIIGRVGPDREKIREELSKLDYQGALAHYQADKIGELVHAIYSQVFENGKWKLLLKETFEVQK